MSDFSTYNQYFIGLIIIYILILLIFKLIKYKSEPDPKSHSFDYYGKKEKLQIIHDDLTPEQINLRFKYLFVLSMIKSASAVKAPYFYVLYSHFHMFSREEIAYLIVIENLTSIIFGPIIGSLSDIYGRKKFCSAYCFIIILNIGLRLTGDKVLAWIAQILSGISILFIDISFESWLNFQASTLFQSNKEGKLQKNSFLREIFTKQIYIDCLTSLLFSGVATLLYNYFGIVTPFLFCILLFFISGVYILVIWEENNIKSISKFDDYDCFIKPGSAENEDGSFIGKLHYSWKLLRNDCPLLLLGIIESLYKISHSLLLYIWTPLLEESTNKIINVGIIYACFMFAKLIGCEFFQGMKQTLKSNTYFIALFITITSAVSLYIDYYFNKFNIRLVSLIYFDCTLGAFHPLMSSLKSLMIPEGSRSTIMTFFRVPINICSIVTLFFSTSITISEICLIGFVLLTMSSIITFVLIIIHSPPDAESIILLTTTEIKTDHSLEEKYFKE